MELKLDLSKVEAERDSKSDILESGEYDVTIVDADVVETNAKTGWILEIYLKVINGDCTGKVVCDRLNIKNTNPKAEEIAYGRLKSILTKIGHNNPNLLVKTEDLFGLKPVSIYVEKKSYLKDGEERPTNDIKRYKELEASSAAASPAPTTETAPAAEAATTTAAPAEGAFPWQQ